MSETIKAVLTVVIVIPVLILVTGMWTISAHGWRWYLRSAVEVTLHAYAVVAAVAGMGVLVAWIWDL